MWYSDDKYEIRPAKNVEEFREMWWGFMRELGWNRGFYDLASYMDPSVSQGMLLLIDKPNSKPCGHISAVINANKTGWVSMFIIDAAHHRKGLGRELFKAAMEDFKRSGTQIMGLDGVVEQKATYERRGFIESPLGTVKIMIRPLLSKEPLSVSELANIKASLVDVREVPQSVLAQHELKYTGFDRPRLWSDEHMFHRPDVTGFALVNVAKPEAVDDLQAWTLVRRCSGGLRIGPVYAGSLEAAKAVLIAAMQSATADTIKNTPLPHEPMSDWPEAEISDTATLVAEVWSGNPEAVQLFEQLGWEYAGVEYHRMWVDAKATPAFSEGGLAGKGVYAVFDAAIG